MHLYMYIVIWKLYRKYTNIEDSTAFLKEHKTDKPKTNVGINTNLKTSLNLFMRIYLNEMNGRSLLFIY